MMAETMRYWRFGAGLAAVLTLATGCTAPIVPTLLDSQEDAYDIKDNFLGANHRVFHSVLNYPHGIGLRVPGYIVGIEKADQKDVVGPKVDKNLIVIPDEGRATTSAYARLRNQSKAHLITHVVKYERAKEKKAIFSGRIRPCALYSLMRADGDPTSTVDAPWNDPRMARQLFPGCGSQKPEAKATPAFSKSWDGIEALRKDIRSGLANDGFTHILVVVMGWNTPQDNAVQNYNSLLAHLLDEVESQRLEDGRCENGDVNDPVCRFKPLVVGVSWASDWELSDVLPIPDALVRLASFPNKANDAKEVGVTWLNAVLRNAVLPARNASGKQAKVIVIGHSFGARATLAALSQPAALALPASREIKTGKFAAGDLFIALQGAFQIKEIFEQEDLSNSPWQTFGGDKLKAVITTSAYDAANETAFWDTYAGMIEGHRKVCEGAGHPDIACAYIPRRPKNQASGSAKPTEGYGFSLCEDKIQNRPDLEKPSGRKFDAESWKKQTRKAVMYVDVTPMTSCRSAYTGGGSHSDIYRRETARFLWDLIR